MYYLIYVIISILILLINKDILYNITSYLNKSLFINISGWIYWFIGLWLITFCYEDEEIDDEEEDDSEFY